MDNITHSFTGALAAKIIETRTVSLEDQPKVRRRIFWVLVLSANLPDIDVALGLIGDRFLSIQHHRGITHSFLFAPIFAILPAILFYTLGKWKNLKILWLAALLGIVLHIFFDLITAFGTRIFLPLSSARYSLDWMFIIDPTFTVVLGVMLLLGKLFSKRKRIFILLGGLFVLLYIGAEAISHGVAYQRIEEFVKQKKIKATKVSVLPQPLSIFRWMGLVQTEDGVLQTFFSVLENSDTLSFKGYPNAEDEFVTRALQAEIAGWYMTFARHPWVRSVSEGDRHYVEFRDLLFSIDETILRSVGFTERSTPFVLRFTYTLDGELLETNLDRRRLEREENVTRSFRSPPRIFNVD